MINGRRVQINSLTGTQISITVPRLIGTGSVSVWKNGIRYTGPLFTYDTVRTVITIAGTGSPGSNDGPGLTASFYYPTGIVRDQAGNLFVADSRNYSIRKIAPDGTVSTFAGLSGVPGSQDGTGTSARFNELKGLGIDRNGSIYAADPGLNHIRKITSTAVVTTLGNGTFGSMDGPLATASFYQPYGIAIDYNFNIYFTEVGNNKIRMISPAGIVSTIAGNGVFGSTDGSALSATFASPSDLAIDAQGNIFVADWHAHKIRKISSGIVTSVAGSSTPGSMDGPGASATFFYPVGVELDPSGNLFVADELNSSIRKIAPDRYVKRYAGGAMGDLNGPALMSTFREPFGLAIDPEGNLYFTDQLNHKVKKVVID